MAIKLESLKTQMQYEQETAVASRNTEKVGMAELDYYLRGERVLG